MRLVLPVRHHSSSHLQAEGSVKKTEIIICSSCNDPVSQADCKVSKGNEQASEKVVERNKSWPILRYYPGI